MSLGHGASIVRDGLVLHLDAANTKKSWKGKPTENLVTDAPSQGGWQGAYQVIDSNTKTFTIETSRSSIASGNSAWRTWYWDVSQHIGTSVTIAMYVELLSETNADHFYIAVGQGNTGSFPIHIAGSNDIDKETYTVSQGEKVYMAWTGVINSTGIVGITQWINNITVDGGNAVLRISNVQIEQNTFATPFVSGTRSSTQAILDLTGQKTITIQNLSYNSDNTYEFDGTDDIVHLNYGNALNPTVSPISVSAWVKSNTTSGTRMWLDAGGGNGSNQRFYSGLSTSNGHAFGSQASTWGGGSVPADTNWHFQTVVMDPNTNTAYVYDNTDLILTRAYTSYTFVGDLRFGGRSGYPWLGKIDVVKIYDKALSASEVRQNFNSTRSRYGV